jgi:hypothetical protein
MGLMGQAWMAAEGASDHIPGLPHAADAPDLKRLPDLGSGRTGRGIGA